MLILRKFRILFSGILLTLLYSTQASCQSPVYFKNFTVESGLSHHYAKQVFRDSKGFYWILTDDGLNRFDGYEFKVYKTNKNDSTSIGSNYTNAIVEDYNGNLWIGTWGGGLTMYHRASDTFVNQFYAESDSTDINAIASFFTELIKDKNGMIWATTKDNGIFIIDAKTFNYKHLHENSKILPPLLTNKIETIIEGNGNDIWIGTVDMGLIHFDRKTYKSTKIIIPQLESKEGGSYFFPYSLFLDAKKRLWIGTWGQGTVLYDIPNQNFYLNEEIHPSLTFNKYPDIWAVNGTKDGRIWLGTDNGLIILDKNIKAFQLVTNDAFDAKSLVANSIKGISVDDTEGVWLGTVNGGVSYYNKDYNKIKHFYKKVNTTYTVNYNYITSICEEKGGKLLIGTDGGGLNIYNPKNGKFQHLIHEPGNSKSIASDKVKSVFQDKMGRIWVGLWAEGIDLFDPESNTFTHYKNQDLDQIAFGSNNVMCMAEDNEGNLIFGTLGSGVYQFNTSTGKISYIKPIIDKIKNVKTADTWDILVDKNNTIWIGSSYGNIFYYNQNNNFVKSFSTNNDAGENSSKVQTIFEDKSGKIWIGTSGEGLKYFDVEDSIFESLDLNINLKTNSVNSIQEDDLGNFWLGTNEGLLKFNRSTGKSHLYGLSDGIQGLNFNRATTCKLKNGQFAFGGQNGLNIFHPDSLPEKQQKIPLTFTNFSLSNKPVIIGNEKSPIKKHISLLDSIVLTYNQSVFSLEYAAINPSSSSKINYAYKLEGFMDGEWQYVGAERKVIYTSLPPKNYLFRVKASIGQNEWLPEELTMHITILPPWWATWWFRVIMIAFAILVIYGVFKLRVHILESQKKELETKVKLRTRELKESNITLHEQRDEINSQNEELQASQEELSTQNHELFATLDKLKETQSQLVQAEKMASLGVLTAGIAHEINNPINFINSSVIGLKKHLSNIFNLLKRYDELNPEHPQEQLQAINEYKEQIRFGHTLELLLKVSDNISVGVDRTTQIIKGLKTFSRIDDKELKSYDINEGIDSTLLLIANQFKDKAEFKKDFENIPLINAYPGKINQVFMNILINAFQAIDKKGIVEISTRLQNKHIKIICRDNGIGMSEEVCQQIFDPFFTTKEVGKGTGLGMYISLGIIQEHKGNIEIKSSLGNGTEVVISLPVNGQNH